MIIKIIMICNFFCKQTSVKTYIKYLPVNEIKNVMKNESTFTNLINLEHAICTSSLMEIVLIISAFRIFHLVKDEGRIGVVVLVITK